MRWRLLESALAYFITKFNGLLLQSATALFLQIKVRQKLLKRATALLLPSATKVITKWDRHYLVI